MATKYVTLKDSNGDTLYPQAVATNLAPGSITPDEIDNRLYDTLAPPVMGATEIVANKDLNTVEFLKVGSYYCPTTAAAATLSNAPRAMAFSMTVECPTNATIDNETTDTWVYRVRKATILNGMTYVQEVSSGGTAGVFSYGPWKRLVDTSTVARDSIVFNQGGYNGSTSGKYCKIMNLHLANNWKAYTVRFTFASTQGTTFAYDVTCTVHRGSATSGIDGVKLYAVALWSTTHDLATRMKAVRISATDVEIYWQTDSTGSGMANIYSATSLDISDANMGSYTLYEGVISDSLPSGTQYSCTVKSY